MARSALANSLLACALFVARCAFAPWAAADIIDEWSFWKVAYADLNGDCVVDLLDAQMISSRYGAVWPDLTYNTRFDVEPYVRVKGVRLDYDIDILDVQKVWGRVGFYCAMFWTPYNLMGTYSLKRDDVARGLCQRARSFSELDVAGGAVLSDPVSVVFAGDATVNKLTEHAQHHGFPYVGGASHQLFWEIGHCSEDDVSAAENDGLCVRCWPVGSSERFHFRAEVADQENSALRYYIKLYESVPDVRLGPWRLYAVATPHFDDNCPAHIASRGHFVPEVFPYPDMIRAGFSGSGFTAGREWVRRQFVEEGSHDLLSVGYWGNTRRISQGCTDDTPRLDGFVYYIRVG